MRHREDAISLRDLEPLDLEPEPQLTHIVPCTALQIGRSANNRPQWRALCGTLCDDLHHVAHDPTCPECLAKDEEDEQTLLAMQQLPPVHPPRVFPKFNDINKHDGFAPTRRNRR